MPDDALRRLAVVAARHQDDIAELQRLELPSGYGNALAAILALPGLRGFWPMTAIDGAGGALDLSGNGLTLANTNNVVYQLQINRLVSYAEFDGTTSSKKLSRAASAAVDIVGNEPYITANQKGLTVGGWFWFDNLSSQQALVDKEGSYLLSNGSGANIGKALFQIRESGGTYLEIVSSDALGTSQWHFLIGRANAHTGELGVMVDGDWTTQAEAWTALSTSANDLSIGIRGLSGTLPLDGRAALVFLCASAVGDSILTTLFGFTRRFFGV